jgi:biopolymer transport protein ExbB/TolQ
VVAYYMATMKKKGWVVEEAVQTEETTTTGDVAASEEFDAYEAVGETDEEELEEASVNQEDAASTGATIEERMEAMAEADLEAHSIRLEQSMKVTDAALQSLTGLRVS